jgi:predicted aldo/keto reductase-like oxidoreductase
MEKVRLGQTDMMVSRLGFGGIPIQRVPEEEAVAVVRRCLELGITLFDTATLYTNSEERIGKAIAGRREGLAIATTTMSRSRDGVARHLNRSLQRLGVQRIDLYQFHQVGDFKALDRVLDSHGPMTVLEKARSRGAVGHIGITSHSLDVAKEAVRSGRFETVMFPLNFISCEAADELVPLAREHDIGFIAMKPLAGGNIDNVPVAFKYLSQFPDVVPIPGVQEIREIEEIVGALEGPSELSPADLSEIERIREELGTRFCRQCDYCQPCDQGILISMVLNSRSYLKRAPREWFFSGLFADALENAAACTECGECEERCPYHLPIREMLAEHVQWYREQRSRHQEGTG